MQVYLDSYGAFLGVRNGMFYIKPRYGEGQTLPLRKVKAITGQTVKEYIRHIRIHRAARLLREEPGRKVGAIAAETGFNSNTYFTREFSKVMGCTPTAYRKRKG